MTERFLQLEGERTQLMPRVVIRHRARGPAIVFCVLVLTSCATACVHQRRPLPPEGESLETCDIQAYPDHFSDWAQSHPEYSGSMLPILGDSVDVPPIRKQREIPHHIIAPEIPDGVSTDNWDAWVLLEAVVEPDGKVYFVDVLEAHAWPAGEQPDSPRTPESQRVIQSYIRAGISMMQSVEYWPGEDSGIAVATIVCVPMWWTARGAP